LPSDVGTFRKSILRLRDLLDVCVFSYETTDKEDKIMDIRRHLDDGYTAIGNFKDLEFVAHTPEEQQNLLLDCLDWARRWTDKSRDHKWDEFFLDPKKEQFQDREYKDLSGYYWKIAEKKPKTYLNGNENLARLTYHMMEFVLNAYHLVVKVKDVTELDNHDEFHDFRKVLRSIDYVATFQPDAGLDETIWKEDYDPSTDLETLNEIYGEFGDLNDKIYSYLHDVESGLPKEKLEEEKKKLNAVWEKLKEDMDKVLHPVKMIESMEAGLKNFD